jgi:hypothetical protein
MQERSVWATAEQGRPKNKTRGEIEVVEMVEGMGPSLIKPPPNRETQSAVLSTSQSTSRH